jgi:hypothetical protein
MTPETKLLLLKQYMHLRIDQYPKKMVPFDVWLDRQYRQRLREIEANRKQKEREHCCYCGVAFGVGTLRGIRKTVDHVVPLSRGGLDIAANRRAACFKCNQWKADKLLSNWLHEIDRAIKKRYKVHPYMPGALERMSKNIKLLDRAISQVKQRQ